MRVSFGIRIIIWACGAVLAGTAAAAGGASPVQFNRDVRPILSDNCFYCHGPDQNHRKADLRLDTHEGALADLGGYHAVAPGDPAASEILARITTDDPDDRMPPPDSGKSLTQEEIDLLGRWIQQGAPWQDHWAYAPPVRATIPDEHAGLNPIDYFIERRLAEEGLKPSSEADKTTLIRRVTFSLTGLPPTPAEIDAFLADDSPDAYERVVDRLLASPRYGEHMARYWLDAARYGDTHGLHLDNERSIWPYRDWVIAAFNDNKPFDEFTVEQLAGDLLPEPTREQLIATGFNRCNVTTSEGGAIPEEFAVRYAVDRVDTVSTVWMATTAGCAVCHDHKFDPLTQKEFYSLYDFFNDLDENPMDGNALLPPPVLKLASRENEARLADFDRRIRLVENVIQSTLDTLEYVDPVDTSENKELPWREFVWIDDELPAGAKPSEEDRAWRYVSRREGPVLSGSRASWREAEETGQHFFENAGTGLTVGRGDILFAHVYLDPGNPPREVMLQFHNGKEWKHRGFWGENLVDFGKTNTTERVRVGDLPEAGRWVRLEVPAQDVGLTPGMEIKGWAFTQHGGRVYWDEAGIVSRWPQGGEGFDSLLAWETLQGEIDKPSLPEPVAKALQTAPAERTDDHRRALRRHFLENVYSGARAVFEPLHAKLGELKRARNAYDGSIPRTLITRDREEYRPAHVLKRGEYDKPGEVVHADVPKVLPPLPGDQPTNRLSLARWLVDPGHPLTARVIMNRFWQQHFGIGIVRTSEDFGSQGEPPVHPELLDWLATEFMARDWDVKAMQKLIVMSATYRQNSEVRPEQLARDPENRLLSRGPRFRFDAETIRDAMLAISGLLYEQIGGRGVRPYQPGGLWEAVAYPSSNTAKYERDSGDALYRRSLYIFWKRTAPPPMMRTFDAPTRESCQVRRERTNTPLQALALLNETAAVEAARHLALRMLREGGEACAARVAYGFRLATGRAPDAEEQAILQGLCDGHLQTYRADPEAAKKLLGVGETRLEASLATPELAAYTMVANTLLNLSETITLN